MNREHVIRIHYFTTHVCVRNIGQGERINYEIPDLCLFILPVTWLKYKRVTWLDWDVTWTIKFVFYFMVGGQGYSKDEMCNWIAFYTQYEYPLNFTISVPIAFPKAITSSKHDKSPSRKYELLYTALWWWRRRLSFITFQRSREEYKI